VERVNRQEPEHVSMAILATWDVKENRSKVKSVSVHSETALSGEYGQDTQLVVPPVVVVFNSEAEFVDTEIQVILVVKESPKKQRTVKLHVNSVQHGHFGHPGHLVQSPVVWVFKIRLVNVTTVVLVNSTVLVLLQKHANVTEPDVNVNTGDHGKVGIHARSHVARESPDEQDHA